MATFVPKKNKDGSIRFAIRFELNGKTQHISFKARFYDKHDIFCYCITEVVQSIEAGTVVKKSVLSIIEENPILKEKLSKAGLIETGEKSTLSAIWDLQAKVCEVSKLKRSTHTSYRTARIWFFLYFQEDRQAQEVTELDAQLFRAWLENQNCLRVHKDQKLKPATISGYIKSVKTVFNTAKKERIISESPFDAVKKGKMSNPKRNFEVRSEWIPNILDACPSQSWRVYIALLRYGGLRKMEPLYLKWSDILWDRGRFYITSKKTERYEGHAGRFSPLWKELEREISALWEMTKPGSEYVLEELRARSENTIYKKVRKTILRAGYNPWTNLLNSMRATRETELKRAGFSVDQITAWIGHSETVSREHYQIKDMLVTEADFERARNFITPTNLTLPKKEAIITQTGT